MFFVISGFYILISIYDVLYLYNNNFKKEIPVYIFIISISIVISLLNAFNIEIPYFTMYFAKFLELLKGILGGFYE